MTICQTLLLNVENNPKVGWRMMYNNALRVQMTNYEYSFPRHHWKVAYAELTFIM